MLSWLTQFPSFVRSEKTEQRATIKGVWDEAPAAAGLMGRWGLSVTRVSAQGGGVEGNRGWLDLWPRARVSLGGPARRVSCVHNVQDGSGGCGWMGQSQATCCGSGPRGAGRQGVRGAGRTGSQQ